MSEFYNQGAVPLSSSAYVSRLFEETVYQEIISNRWVLLLGPRQHGKSTSLVRLRTRFQEAKLIVGSVDLQRLPPYESYVELLTHISDQLGRSMGINAIPRPAPESQTDFLSWLQVTFPAAAQPIVIIVDECASIEHAGFRNSLYGQIRQINSQKADAGPTDIATRVRFIFSGTFRSETLVSEQNSPFNVCQPVATDDLTLDQARELAANVHADLVPFVDRVFAVVGGQPFLLQTIFLEATRPEQGPLDGAIELAVNEIRNIASPHLQGIFGKIFPSPSLVEKVTAMVRQGHTRLVPTDSDCTFLQTLGLAKRDGTNLVFRNQLYSEVARETPQLLPVEVNVQHAPVLPLEKSSLNFMHSDGFRDIAFSSYEGGANAHNHGNFRLALTGFGAAMEAILIDFLVAITPTDRTAAITRGRGDRDRTKNPNFNNFEDENDPTTWRLVNLINVARQVRVGTTAPEPNHALREWRNLIHPAQAIRNFVDESMLEPESLAASAMFAILLRDISRAVAATP